MADFSNLQGYYVKDAYSRERIELLENGYVTPQMFGGVGDGVTDDTIAINTAINNSPSGIVVFPKGTYLISGYIKPKDDTYMVGYGAHFKGVGNDLYCFLTENANNVHIEGIELSNFIRAFDFRGSNYIELLNVYAHNMYKPTDTTTNYFCQIMNCSHVLINGVRWENANKYGDCIRLKDNVSHCHIKNVSGYSGDDFIAIVPDENEGTHTIENVVFENIRMEYPTFNGVRIQPWRTGSKVKNISFKDCSISSWYQHCVKICASVSGWHEEDKPAQLVEGIAFENCEFNSESGSTGINLFMNTVNIKRLRIKDCHFKNSAPLTQPFVLADYLDMEDSGFVNCSFENNIGGYHKLLAKFNANESDLDRVLFDNLYYFGREDSNGEYGYAMEIHAPFFGAIRNSYFADVNRAILINASARIDVSGNYGNGNGNALIAANKAGIEVTGSANTIGTHDVTGGQVTRLWGDLKSDLTPATPKKGDKFIRVTSSDVSIRIYDGSKWKSVYGT